MAKGKRKKAPRHAGERSVKQADGLREVEPSVAGAAAVAPPPGPQGQRLWDMPYSSAAPRMINPELGLHNLVARAGHNAGYDIDLTLLDAPDHRLIRSGVLLAHRVLDGRGEWYLGAPDWVPLLPKERIDPMSHGDLPEELADLIRPFRRRATLGPVAALRCERREFALRDDHGTTMALLRDDKVTVRRNGLTTARYREVMLTPVGPGLTEQQHAWLCQVLAEAGATPVIKFPRLVARLGAPANGQSDFPVLPPPDPATRFAAVVATLLARRLRELLRADLLVRNGDPDGAAEMARVARLLRCELQGLAPALDREWWEDVSEDLAWLAEQAESGEGATGGTMGDTAADSLKRRLRGERPLTLLERLVAGVRAPRVVDPDGRSAGEVLDTLLSDAERQVEKTADRIAPDSAPRNWDAMQTAVVQLARTADVVEAVQPGRLNGLRERLDGLLVLLDECVRRCRQADAIREQAAAATPEEAFELGRSYERELTASAEARTTFVKHWTKTRKKIGPLRKSHAE